MAETALNRAHRRRIARIRTRLNNLVIAADVADTDAFVSNVVPLVLDAQREVVGQTDVYLSTEAGLATRSSTEPWGLDAEQLIGARARLGDALESVYGRNHRAAVGSFVERMARETATDVALAERGATFTHTAGDERIVGYRRTLTSRKPCGLCVAAATRTYSKQDLQPLHLHCGCGVQPQYRAVPGWTKPTNDMLRRLYTEAGGTESRKLMRIRPDIPDVPDVDIVTTNLGPTLVPAAA